MIELIDIFQLRDGSPCIVIEYVEKGSLLNLLVDGQTLLEKSHIKNLAY